MQQRRGFSLGSIGGTTLRVEPMFLVLAAFFVIVTIENQTPLARALLWIPVLFVSILLHELGHAGTIAALGFGSSAIYLTGMGGVTVNQRVARPWQDILISLAGPAASVLLAILCRQIFASSALAQHDPMLREMLPMFVWANFSWAILNMIPIYPLDGGQVFFNFIRLFASDRSARAVSVWGSIVFASGLLIFSLFRGEYFLAAISAMLIMQNYQRWQFREPSA